MSPFPLAGVRRPFRAAAQAFVPELLVAPDATWDRLERTITAALAERPVAITRQLALFVRLLDLLAVVTRGRRLAGLPPERRIAFLRRFERSRRLLVRRGLAGLRTLVFLGYYTDPEVVAGLGYHPSPLGWDARP